MSDLLVRQLQGRYVENRLTCRTSMDLSFITNISEREVEQMLKVKMASQMANDILDGKKVMWKVSPPTGDYYGKMYQLQTYVFHPEQFEQLIKDAFNAGVESAKAENGTES